MPAISAISCWPSSAVALSLEASGARPTISRVCASSAVSWRSSLAIWPSRSPFCPSRLWRRARASAVAAVSWLRRASAPFSVPSGLLECGERLLLEIGGQPRRVGKRSLFGLEPVEALLGLADQRPFAGKIAVELIDAGVQLPIALGGALHLALEVVLLDFEAGEDRALRRFLVAQRLQAGAGVGLGSQRLGLGFGGARDLLQRGGEVALLGIDLPLRFGPAQMQQDRLDLADLGGELLVAPRLPRLAPQALDLRLELAQDVVEALQIAVRRLEAQLGLVAAAVQAGDAGGIFQDAPALLGLGVDQFPDLALAHERRRAGARGGVLEQDAHVAGTHLAAVDAIGGACVALDAARHLDHDRSR